VITAQIGNGSLKPKASYPNAEVIAVVNPYNGPAQAVDDNFKFCIPLLKKAGISVLGYVFTRWGNVTDRNNILVNEMSYPITSVNDDIDRWYNFYPGLIDGIFLDEGAIVNDSSIVNYYKNISVHVKSKTGLRIVLSNPGTPPNVIYKPLFDIIIIWENNVYPTTTNKDLLAWKSARLMNSLVLHSTPLDTTKLTSLLPFFKYVYITEGPYSAPTTTINKLFAAVNIYVPA